MTTTDHPVIPIASSTWTGRTCPAQTSSGEQCGALPAIVDKGTYARSFPLSVRMFCEGHLGLLDVWAGKRQRIDEQQRLQTIAEYEREKAAKLEAESVVYFLRIPRANCYLCPGDHIKIGTTARFESRLAAHRRTFGSVEVLLTIKGRLEAERTMHRKFSYRLVKGQREVFHGAPELLEWIAEQVAKQGARVA